MSQIDIQNAKVALTRRLEMWGTPGDIAHLAGGFIDDLVSQGWQMAPFRETRPFPPRTGEACAICGKSEPDCVRNPHSAHEFEPIRRTVRAALHPTTLEAP